MAKAAVAIAVDPLTTHLGSTKQRELEPPRISVWEPTVTQTARPVVTAIPIEQRILDVIVKPIAAGEGHRDGNDRKEREIAALLATLTPVQSLALEKRLAIGATDDTLANAFGRLTVERRNRLVASLSRNRAIAATRAQRRG